VAGGWWLVALLLAFMVGGFIMDKMNLWLNFILSHQPPNKKFVIDLGDLVSLG
jgi:hypothetical protein